MNGIKKKINHCLYPQHDGYYLYKQFIIIVTIITDRRNLEFYSLTPETL